MCVPMTPPSQYGGYDPRLVTEWARPSSKKKSSGRVQEGVLLVGLVDGFFETQRKSKICVAYKPWGVSDLSAKRSKGAQRYFDEDPA
ncbi:hypothetical protein TNCV_2829321 [Trichonephila clavipes]|nr:hypothetical protein TNCV_2829321 [Trichonephila clavipes]